MIEATARIYFADGKYILVPIDSLSTCAEVSVMVASKLGLKDSSPFAIIETGMRDRLSLFHHIHICLFVYLH